MKSLKKQIKRTVSLALAILLMLATPMASLATEGVSETEEKIEVVIDFSEEIDKTEEKSIVVEEESPEEIEEEIKQEDEDIDSVVEEQEEDEEQEENPEDPGEQAEAEEEPDSENTELLMEKDGSEDNPHDLTEDITVMHGEYTVSDEVTNPNRLEVENEAIINLKSGCVLKLPKGIHVKEGCSLTIQGTGALIIDNVDESNAGIGGDNDENGGEIIIEGGQITVTGGEDAAGIGGGNRGNGGIVEISGGVVTVQGGSSGAGIGGGFGLNGRGTNFGNSGTVEISGGTVKATGGRNGAGIGGGNFGNGEDITISGGTVKATGGDQASGIGGGRVRNCGTVTITGGTVTAIGGYLGAGIGGGHGDSNRHMGDGGNVTIEGGNVTAIGGDRAAGIGGGREGAGGNLTVNGGNVAATGGAGAPSIGRGGECPNKTMGTFDLGTGLSVFDTSKAGERIKIDNPTPSELDKYKRVNIGKDSQIAVEPIVNKQFTYNGEEHDAIINPGIKATLSGSTKATNVGTYTITATPDEGCVWNSDLTSTPKEYNWTINPKDVSSPYRVEVQTIVKGSECFADPILYDWETHENITGTMTYRYNSRERSKEYIIASMAELPADGSGTIFWEFTANENFTGTISGSIIFRIADIKFTVKGETADATNAVTIKDNPTYGDTWDQIVTIKSNDIEASLNGVEGKGEYTLYDTGAPDAGEREYAVQFDGSFNDIQYININVFTDKVNIAKAEYSDVTKEAFGEVNAQEGSGTVIVLPDIPKGSSYGTPKKAVDNDPYELFSIKGNRIPLFMTETPTRLEPMIFTVPVIADRNHNDYTITVTVTPKSGESDDEGEGEGEGEGGSYDPGYTPRSYSGASGTSSVREGRWEYHADGDYWTYTKNGILKNTWAYIYNPYAKPGQHKADWYYFNESGKMLTGWQKINNLWYYLYPYKDGTGTLGACLIGPAWTPDGYEVDANGAWTGKKR